MSIRIQVDGTQDAKHQLVEVSKGVYAIRDAEVAATKAAKERVRAQKETFRAAGGGGGAVQHMTRSSEANHYFRAAGLIGGEGGSLVRHLGHAVGAPTAGLGMLAAGALAAGIALKALEAASERAAASAEREAKFRVELKNAMRESVKAADASAVGAFAGNRDAITSLLGIGGDELLGRAQSFSRQNGAEGVQAFATLAQHGALNNKNIDAIQAAFGTGQIGLAGAASALTSGKVAGEGDPLQIAAAILTETTNRAVSPEDVKRMGKTFSSSLAGGRVSAFQTGEGAYTASGIGRFLDSPTVLTHQQDQFNRLVNPESAARSDIARQLEDTLAPLRAGSQAEWTMVAILKDIGYVLGMGSGSRATQYAEAAGVGAQL